MTPEQEAKIDQLLKMVGDVANDQIALRQKLENCVGVVEVLVHKQGIQQESLKSAWDAIMRAVDRRKDLDSKILSLQEVTGNAFDAIKSITDHLGIPALTEKNDRSSVSSG